ncbi:fructose-2,6-bisphosphatase TIGAR-like [Saccostrea echinata]|uniref:fructose-2,6-bisphosphatase TIGAR-like n=1 Tax=Saccostrea echinata TaxID=191078 RepID=UPI002A7F5FDE|nr:fructose-2,6-bisphosphatase TIGAR-like [Saccostrea echinata]
MVYFSFTIVRHGETSYNRERVIQGQTDIPLSGIGHEQAHRVAERLQNEQYSHIFSSDLSRAQETAEAIIKSNAASNCQLSLDKRLRERRFGEYEGRPSEELMEAANRISPHSWTDFNPPGGETLQQVHDRAISFFNDLCKKLVNEKSNTKNEKRSHSESESLYSSQAVGNKKSAKSIKTASPKTIQGRVMDIGEIILPNTVTMDNINLVTSAGNSSTHEENDKEFIVFQDDTNSESSGKSKKFEKSKDHLSTKSQCDKKHNGFTATFLQKGRPLKDFISDAESMEEWPTVADVLVVSHGGLIKELVKFFIEKLNCKMPAGNRNGLRIYHNCSVSKFLVSLPNENRSDRRVTCLFSNSKEHLQGLGIEFAEGKY